MSIGTGFAHERLYEPDATSTAVAFPRRSSTGGMLRLSRACSAAVSGGRPGDSCATASGEGVVTATIHRVALSHEEFSSSYRLLRTVGAVGARSYHALDVATGNVVMVHLMDRDDHAMLSLLDERVGALSEDHRRGLIVGAVHGIPFVVTQFVTGLTSLRSWLNDPDEAETSATTDPPTVASPIVSSDDVEAFDLEDEDADVVDILTLIVHDEDEAPQATQELAPSNPTASERPTFFPPAEMPMQMHLPVRTLADARPVPPMTERVRSTPAAGGAGRHAPRIVAGPAGRSFVAPAAGNSLSFAGSMIGVTMLGLALGAVVYLIGRV
jgi:hypothetical protein